MPTKPHRVLLDRVPAMPTKPPPTSAGAGICASHSQGPTTPEAGAWRSPRTPKDGQALFTGGLHLIEVAARSGAQEPQDEAEQLVDDGASPPESSNGHSPAAATSPSSSARSDAASPSRSTSPGSSGRSREASAARASGDRRGGDRFAHVEGSRRRTWCARPMDSRSDSMPVRTRRWRKAASSRPSSRRSRSIPLRPGGAEGRGPERARRAGALRRPGDRPGIGELQRGPAQRRGLQLGGAGGER